jgi:hypothetical protein
MYHASNKHWSLGSSQHVVQITIYYAVVVGDDVLHFGLGDSYPPCHTSVLSRCELSFPPDYQDTGEEC